MLFRSPWRSQALRAPRPQHRIKRQQECSGNPQHGSQPITQLMRMALADQNALVTSKLSGKIGRQTCSQDAAPGHPDRAYNAENRQSRPRSQQEYLSTSPDIARVDPACLHDHDRRKQAANTQNSAINQQIELTRTQIKGHSSYHHSGTDTCVHIVGSW